MPDKSKDSTIYGLNGVEWNSDFTATRDNKGLWSGSESFTCKLEEATKYTPSLYSPCQLAGWGFMSVVGVKVANIEGNLASVTCEYQGYNFEVDGNGDEVPKYTYELGITTGTEPIEANYRYREVSADELKIIQNYKSGQLRDVKDSPYKYQNSTDHEKAKIFEITSDLGKELIDKVKKGVDSYLQPGQIWRVSFASKTLPPASILNSVGKITSALNAPNLSDGRNWLFIGCNVSGADKAFSITYEWQLSGLGGWSSDLYS